MPPDPPLQACAFGTHQFLQSWTLTLTTTISHLLQNFLTTLLNAGLSQRCLSDTQSRQTEQNTHLHYMYLLNQLTNSISQGLV